MPPPDEIPPFLVAVTDRHRAALDQILDHVREHRKDCGARTLDCIGERARDAISEVSRRLIEQALVVALCRLADQPAPPSTVDGIDLSTVWEGPRT